MRGLLGRLTKVERRLPPGIEQRVTMVTWILVDPKDYPHGGAPVSGGAVPDDRPESEKPKPGESAPWEFVDHVPC
jgi:hypothetical protein